MQGIPTQIEKLSGRTVFLLLFGYALAIRLPFFFRDYIDRDESTFILLGQSLVEGNLPFTELWDIKPPLIFFFFACIIYIFGKSFIAIRLTGTVLVALTAFFTYKLTAQETSKKVALCIGLLCVVLQSLFGSLQGVMSEHIAMAFLTPALWLLTKKSNPVWIWIVVGILTGCSLMVKLNLAYVALFLGLALCYRQLRQQKSIYSVISPFLYGIGILLVIGLTFIPYYFDGTSALWWRSVIEAPLAYAGAREYSPWKLLLYFLPFLGLFWVGFKKKIFSLNNTTLFYLTLACLGTLLAFVKSGRVNGHYLILIYPIILPLVGMLASNSFLKSKKILPATLLIFILVPAESYLEYYAVLKHKIERSTFFNGEGISVPTYFKQKGMATDSLYFAEYHIGYWLLDTRPPTKAATQPSNILKDEMFFAYDNPRKTGGEELQFILEQYSPKHIITRKNRRVFDKKQYAANFYIQLQLRKHYHPLDTVDNAVIHQRLKR